MSEPVVRRVWRPPDPRLGGLVGAYRCYRDPGGAARVHVPSDDLTLIFGLAGALRIHDPDGRERILHEGEVYLGGLQTTPAATSADGPQSGIVVRLSPAGAHRLLRGLPQHELVDRSVWLDGCHDVTESLAIARDDRERFARIDAFLRARLDSATECAQTRWAWSALLRSRGRMRIDALTRELGWSRKKLSARFRDQVGMTPKRAARLLRFDHAIELARAGRLRSAEIAAACGFADQAHLAREVRAFAGVSASALGGVTETNVQDTWLDLEHDVAAAAGNR